MELALTSVHLSDGTKAERVFSLLNAELGDLQYKKTPLEVTLSICHVKM